MMDVMARFRQLMGQQAWALNGTKVIVAVSGGADSVALLALFHHFVRGTDIGLIVAHVNHKLRANESDEDERFVRRLAARFQCQYFSKEIDMRSWKTGGMGNLQDVARQARYQFLCELAEQTKASFVATAHHLDDFTETLLMRLLRGSGTGGVNAIAVARPLGQATLIRPLLDIPKQALLDYCAREQIDWRLDASNLSDAYTRNGLRLHVLPEIEKIFPSYRTALARYATITADDDALLTEQTEQLYAQIVAVDERGYMFSRLQFLTVPVALQRRLLKRLLNRILEAEYAFALIESIRTAIVVQERPNGVMPVAGQLQMVRNYDEIRFSLHDSSVTNTTVDMLFDQIKGMIKVDEIEIADFDVTQVHSLPSNEAWFDADKLSLPLLVRGRIVGDRLHPFGMDGSLKVKKVMIDLKVPVAERERIPLVFDNQGRLLWIAGLRRSRHAPLDRDTKRIIRLIWL